VSIARSVQYTPTGPVGLLKDQGRKCLHIHSNGGFHFGKEEDHSVPYLKSIMGFMGIDDFESVVVEGVDAIPDQAEAFKHAAVIKARAVAGIF
jgi:FMN-dependent NADH-azoreductase